MVAVAGTIDAPRIVERRRIVIADPATQGSKFPYHTAALMPFPEVEAFVRKAIESSRALALHAISAAVRALVSEGNEIAGCGVLAGSGKALPGLEAILASHALIHAAEGVLYREVLVWAANELHLKVTCVREKGLDPEALKRVEPLGKRIGPPWTLDQKYATVAALAVLAAPGDSSAA